MSPAATGDIAALKPLHELRVLALHGPHVLGDLFSLRGLSKLNSLTLHSVQVSGDLFALENLGFGVPYFNAVPGPFLKGNQKSIPKPPKVGKIMAQDLKKAIILHAFRVQVLFPPWLHQSPGT